MAVIQANNLLEDYSQLESGPMSSVDPSPQGTFVGVYDGHGGPEAARFVNERLFENIKSKFLLLIYDELHSYSNDCIMSFMESQSGLLIFL
jgi:serine/threonine protein phosphatase PrpC